jgi:hypothetical protein
MKLSQAIEAYIVYKRSLGAGFRGEAGPPACFCGECR